MTKNETLTAIDHALHGGGPNPLDDRPLIDLEQAVAAYQHGQIMVWMTWLRQPHRWEPCIVLTQPNLYSLEGARAIPCVIPLNRAYAWLSAMAAREQQNAQHPAILADLHDVMTTAAEFAFTLGLNGSRPLAENTLARVARGMKRYVLDAERPFLVNLTHGGRVEDAAAPIRTITGAHRGEKALVAPSMMSLKGTDRRDSRIDAPHPTVLAGGGHSALLVPSLQRFNGGATGADLREPAPTVTANSYIKRPGGAAPLGIIAPVLTYAQQGGHNRPAEAPHHTITASNKDQNSVMVAGLVQTGYGERPGQQPRALDPQAPLGTVVAGGAKHAPFAALLAQQNGGPRMEGFPGRPATAPASTITASGSQQTPVAAFLTKYYGQGTGATLTEPCHTVTVDDRFGHIQASLEAPPFTPAHEARARQVADFLRAHDAWDGGGEYVTLTIDGARFVVVDIGLRMLTPRELFTAQGFPADYVIEGVWDEGTSWEMLSHNGGPTFREFPKNVQVSCCGNSVCPPLAEALVRANCAHLAVETIPNRRLVEHAR